MKRIITILIIALLPAGSLLAQNPIYDLSNNGTADTAAVADTVEAQDTLHLGFTNDIYYLGLRGGMNLANMSYSRYEMRPYDHHRDVKGMIGLFAHIPLFKSNFSIRPEVTYLGRGTHLTWHDIDYKLHVNYLDLRMPLTYNFIIKDKCFSPYLMLVPMYSLATTGDITYEDYMYNGGSGPNDKPIAKTDITEADIHKHDFSLMLGAGVDFLLNKQKFPILLSVEAGYNFGLVNTFAQREIYNNPEVAEADRSIIINPFFGSELWRESRKNNGIEVAVRVGLPLNNPYRQRPPEPELPVYPQDSTLNPDLPDTVDNPVPDIPIPWGPVPGGDDKECYSFAEMVAFITLGVDISDKKICMFNINFDFDKDVLRPESKSPLMDVAALMRAYPDMKIYVYGHTDSIGSDAYNQELSERRARTVADFIIGMGVETSRIRAFGFGESRPLESNSTEEGRFHNRRVEFDIINVGIRRISNVDTRSPLGNQVEESGNETPVQAEPQREAKPAAKAKSSNRYWDDEDEGYNFYDAY